MVWYVYRLECDISSNLSPQRYRSVEVDFPFRSVYMLCIFDLGVDLWKSNTCAL